MLRVEGLERRVGGFRLHIDRWSIEPGRYLVLVGRSGAGKTMFLETVAGLHRADAGRVWIGGRDVTREPPETRGIGFVYQDCWLFPHLTVRQNIDFGRRYHRDRTGDSGIATDDLAGVLHIGNLLERRPVTLSAGERQRVALARALAIQPRLLLIDEPLGTLDPETREQVATELLNCHRTFKMTTIHVTHDHTEARMMGDSVAVIHDGRLAQTGATDEVFHKPATAELAGFLGCENRFEADAAVGDAPEHVRIRLDNVDIDIESACRGRVVACIRPENVLIEAAASGHSPEHADIAASYAGSIVEVSRRGATVRLVTEAGDLRWVSLISQSQQRACRFDEGDAVRLRIPTDAIHLVEADPNR